MFCEKYFVLLYSYLQKSCSVWKCAQIQYRIENTTEIKWEHHRKAVYFCNYFSWNIVILCNEFVQVVIWGFFFFFEFFFSFSHRKYIYTQQSISEANIQWFYHRSFWMIWIVWFWFTYETLLLDLLQNISSKKKINTYLPNVYAVHSTAKYLQIRILSSLKCFTTRK